MDEPMGKDDGLPPGGRARWLAWRGEGCRCTREGRSRNLPYGVLAWNPPSHRPRCVASDVHGIAMRPTALQARL